MKKTFNIFLVDDHPVVRMGLRIFLESTTDYKICGEAEDATEALNKIAKLDVDFAIIDISLKGTNGIELTKNITNRYKNIKVLIMSMHDEKDYIDRSIKAGAKGYLLKSDSEEYLLKAIKTIMDGNFFLSESLQNKMLDSMWKNQQEKNPLELLTNRELQIFNLIGKGLTTSQIGKKLNLTASTIGTYRERIKTKLNIETSHELIRFAMENKIS